MTDDKFFEECFLCRRNFQFGPHVYDGKPVKSWNIMVCNRCLRANWDGIVIEGHPRLAAHLEGLGIKIERNAKGWVNWPSDVHIPG